MSSTVKDLPLKAQRVIGGSGRFPLRACESSLVRNHLAEQLHEVPTISFVELPHPREIVEELALERLPGGHSLRSEDEVLDPAIGAGRGMGLMLTDPLRTIH